MKPSTLTAERLRQVLSYDPATGVFTRILRTHGKVKIGSVAGSPNSKGYLQCRVDNRLYLLSRLAFLYMTGKPPSHGVDHINGIRTDNRWANLRDVPQRINCENRRSAGRHSKTGLLGVSPRGSGFVATIGVRGSKLVLGSFDDPRVAHAAYLAAKRRHHVGNTL